MKNIKEQFKQLVASNAKSNWVKGVFYALLICFGVFVVANTYLLFRPISADVKGIIDEEVDSSNISFDQKTIDSIKKRQEPSTSILPSGGKNPFTPL